MMIPQTNPKAGYLACKAEIDAAIAEALESGWYILGQQVAHFETEFAHFVGTQHAVGVANGTDALHLALRGLHIGPGDTVITASHTAVATVAAIELAGATPFLVDIDPHTYTIDVNQVDDLLSRGEVCAKAIIPVHIYGQMADMSALLDVASCHGLLVIEDCAQAHGARWQGKQAGTWGNAAAFSFYPTKNLGALGDGGAVVTNDRQVAERIKSLRQYGWDDLRNSQEPGLNSRLDELQAAILRVRLRHLAAENERRRAIARAYTDALAATHFVLPQTMPGAEHVYHQYVVRTPARDELRRFLRDKGIGTGIHYPTPVHLQPAYRGRLPIAPSLAQTEKIVEEICSLPMFPQLSDQDVAYVASAVAEFGCVTMTFPP